MSERTPFEAAAEQCIIDRTDEMLRALDEVAARHGATVQQVEQACGRFFGGDLADCWANYAAEADR